MAEDMQHDRETAALDRARERFGQRQPPLADRSAEPVANPRLTSPVPRALLRVEGVETDMLPPVDDSNRRIPIGPSCWMLVSESDDAAGLRPRLSTLPDDAMVTDLGHGWTRIRLQGAAARAVLQHGIDLDLHPDAWPVGRGAATAYRTLPVLLHAPMAECFDVYTLRSLAECLWEWLVDAAAGVDENGGGT